jgi:uncharacterized protein
MTRNPFRFGALALDEAFADREQELGELRADVLNGQDVVVLGRRRLGKSSLVQRAMRDLGGEGVLVAYVDLMTTPTKEKLAERLARAIHESVASPLYRARERALSIFRGLRVQPQITVDPSDATVTFGFDAAQRPADIDATLERLLQLPAELAADRGRVVALVLDEFQEIVEIDPQLLRLMRAVFQTQPETAHVYLGSKRHVMEKIFRDENEPFWRSARLLELGPIDSELFTGFVLERFATTGQSIAPDAARLLVELTGGHPYATQELAYFAWEEAAAGTEEVTTEALERALQRLLESEDAHFGLVWERASRNEKLVLLALAAEPGRAFTSDYRRRHRLPPATNVQRSLAGLRARELVEKGDDGRYRIVEPFLAEWIAGRQG